jgi:hypothetical protein
VGASAVTFLSLILEMPFTGNHWVVAGMVGLAIVVTAGKEGRFIPTARLILLVFYAFAAFAKLNQGFFEPSVSCAVFFGNQSLRGLGLPTVDTSSIVASGMVWATVVIECSIPLLLIWRRTRYAGVVVGSVFHTIVAFDWMQHFYDFTSVLLALFFLFLPDRSVEAIASAVARVPARLRRLTMWWWSIIASGLVLLAVQPLTPTSRVILLIVPFAIWLPCSLLWIAVLIWARTPSTVLSWKPGIAGGLVLAVVSLNGLTPYAELKTANSFNMYSNLVTAGGESNHFIIRRTLPLRSDYSEPIEILRSSDPVLQIYATEGYLVPEPQLRRYLAEHPDVDITMRVSGTVISLPPASMPSRFSDPGPWWWRFLALRPVDTRSPARCQDASLPALWAP